MQKRNFVLAVFATAVILWGCSEEYSPDSPETPQSAAGKIAAEGFRVDRERDYDPFMDMDRRARFEALGGVEGATAYYELIVIQLAQALQDKRAREITHANTPEREKSEAKLAKMAIDNADLLRALSMDFKAEVDQI